MKRLLISTALLAGLFALPAEGRIVDVTAWYGWIDLSGDTTLESIDPDEIDDVDIDFDSETGYGLGLNFFIGNRLSLAASIHRFEPDAFATAANPALPPLALGELEVVPLSVVLQLHLLPNSVFDPYIGVGVGYVLVDDLENRDDVAQIEFDRVELEDDYGVVFNLGFSFDLMSGFALNVDAKYIPVESAATVVFLAGPEEQGEIEVNPLILSAGLSFQF